SRESPDPALGAGLSTPRWARFSRPRPPADSAAGDDSATSENGPPDLQLARNALFLLAALFSVFNILFIIVSSPPLGRFMDAAGVFWLPWFCLLFVDRWQTIPLGRRTAGH
ncbi:MAG: hypothetical protein HUU20_15720, partial [Pirellulales bacterium]|nr:hypothetical protein [Pirellulales bacterium]